MNKRLHVTGIFFKNILLAIMSMVISIRICHAQKIEECDGAGVNKFDYCVSDPVINRRGIASYDLSMNFYAINYLIGMSFTFVESLSSPKILRLNRATKVNFLFEDSSILSFEFKQIPNVYPNPNNPQQDFPEEYLAISSHPRFILYEMKGPLIEKKHNHFTYDNYIEIRPTELIKFATTKLVRVDFLPLSEYQSRKSMFQPFQYEITEKDQMEILEIVSCFYSVFTAAATKTDK